MENKLRIATFNLENLEDKPGLAPSLDDRIAVLRPQLIRLDADIICFQEIHGQEIPGQPRQLLALKKLLTGTKYENFHMVSSMTAAGQDVYNLRNLVIISRFEIEAYSQIKNDDVRPPVYRKVTAIPAEDAKEIRWERPILYAKINLPDNKTLHVFNLHLKSKRPSDVEGQSRGIYSWNSAAGWAERFFISSMKRVGQALETRILIDRLLDDDEDAMIAVCGDFNADQDSVPLMAIRGAVEQTGNSALAGRALFPCENNIPESMRYSLFYQGKGMMIDHLLVTRNLMQYYRFTEVHNEMLHDESVSNASDKKYPESDHAPVVAEFRMP